MGYGAGLVALAFLMLLCYGSPRAAACRGDAFLVGAVGLIVALIILFVFFPVAKVLVSAVQDNAGAFAPGEFFEKFFDRSVWGLDCLGSSCAAASPGTRCSWPCWSGSARPRCWASPSR